VRTVSAVAGEVIRLADWMAEHQVCHVAMEATGQFWNRVWDVLAERGFELMLVNARHVKMVPGRKTDVADATWLAELLEHGVHPITAQYSLAPTARQQISIPLRMDRPGRIRSIRSL
jgi:transposase